jgi:fucokinase
VVADPQDRRVGSGTATLLAVAAIAPREGVEHWWRGQRVLLIHSGGDARRLPAYSLTGKLFSALPVRTPFGEVSTVFDETLALSTAWVERMQACLVVAAGDVVLMFDAGQVDWNRPGIVGVAMRQPAEVGTQHGVYVLGPSGEVYSFLQKPSAAQVREAGGMLAGGQVALDNGLRRYAPDVAARLTLLGQGLARAEALPVIDLYHPAAGELLHDALRAEPFRVDLVDGDFTHVGTTSHFRRLMTEDTSFSALYEAQQRLGSVVPRGVRSSGVLVDCVLERGGELAPCALAIECDLSVPLRVGRGGIAHGLTGMERAVEIPEETVAHQVPVAGGVVIRVYGVADDPKTALWLGRVLEGEDLWEDGEERTLWNARLFPVLDAQAAWRCAAWQMGLEDSFTTEEWRQARRMSLASSAAEADVGAVGRAKTRRARKAWELTAAELCRAGADVRPMLAHAPGVGPTAETGAALEREAEELEAAAPTEAASRHFQAHLFLAQAGLEEAAARAEARAFACVRSAVDRGESHESFPEFQGWVEQRVEVRAPARVDFGGGWSDTPPFCLDWGGTVLNAAVKVNGAEPIRTVVTRIADPVIRCVAEDGAEQAEYRNAEEALAQGELGSALAIPRVALELLGAVRRGQGLSGGLEIRTGVDLPMGSGLGTSSILAATVLKALSLMAGFRLTDAELSAQVMRLEQKMGTGGGWQDQAGAIYAGAKLLVSGPGLSQRVRVEPVRWSEARQAEFAARFIGHYTGIRRIARNLLSQVVGSYLARETRTVQVLHSIKTLAMEMRHAMEEGEWAHLGELMWRHWELNKQLDPHTTNAPIEARLEELRPHLAGAKLAGAGGGGFLMLLARSAEEGAALRARLGSQYGMTISTSGLVTHAGE